MSLNLSKIMKVKCIGNSGKFLLDMGTNLFGVTKFNRYDEILLNNEYLVMGLLFQEQNLYYIVDDGYNLVTILPIQLFEIIETRIFSEWSVKYLKHNKENVVKDIICICSDNIISNYNDLDLLTDQDSKMLKKYFNEKKNLLEMDLHKSNKIFN